MKAAFVIKFYTGALSTRVITGDSRYVCIATGVERAIFIKYNTGALSTGVIRGKNSEFCSTI